MPRLTETDWRLLQALRAALPRGPQPFAALGALVGLTEADVLERLRAWRESGLIRRLGAFVDHRRGGYTANAMVVWTVAEADVAALGQRLAATPGVSHCYARPCRPHWPYRLYTMVHGASREAVLTLVRELAADERLAAHRILFTVREFKKSVAPLPPRPA